MEDLARAVSGLSEEIWDMKYRLKQPDGEPLDLTIEDTWRRVATAVAEAEPEQQRPAWSAKFYEAMADFAFLPAGRILAGAGADRRVTLFNCFVMGTIGDDMASIFQNVKEAALTMQLGGGIGHDFSTLRPKGAPVRGVGADASGPLSFMDVWDAMCRTILSAGARRGAMMGTLRCDHPDIEAFIEAKSDPARLRMFNLSVLVTDPFIAAVRADEDWDLSFGGRVYKTVRARALWQKIMRATYDYAEPGVIFIDRVNAANNLAFCETIQATNPCGEQPLPPYGACLLGSINLARLVRDPFTDQAGLDEVRLQELVRVAVRFLDNVIDVSRYPLARQRKEALAKRRIGLGVTGLADALIMSRERYGSETAIALARRWMAQIERAAYLASTELAAEKGAFPLFDVEAMLGAPGIARLDDDVRAAIAEHGLRNGLLTSIAPTGTISLLAGNVSSGVEPVFDFLYKRRIKLGDGDTQEERVEDFAHRLFRQKFGEEVALPDYFVSTGVLCPQEHLAMQAALQPHVDSAISKTINCPPEISFEAFEQIYLQAYDLGLKGCTTYRPNPVTGAVLESEQMSEPLDAAAGLPGEPLAVSPGASDTYGATPIAHPIQTTEVSMPDLAAQSGDVVYMSRPLEREPVLSGCTYKLRWPDSDHALYVTVNDIVKDGRRRPFEIFINSKNLEHYAWTVALTRMISAVFRRGGDVSFVVEELKAVFDPRGGQWMGGRYVPSLLAAIGEIVEQHMIATGFIQREGDVVAHESMERLAAEEQMSAQPRPAEPSPASTSARPRLCPRCNFRALIHQEGCLVCRQCGYSKCS
ncbi:MAG: adenosylcobalamin-dependent ribonucleoside-diphosphate reductase [Hyphomicrobiaceae bacterium]